MPFANVAGYVLDFTQFAEMPEEYAGEEVIAFNNTLLSTQTSPKRKWTGELRPYTTAEVAAFRSAIAYGQKVTCSGDAFGGSYTCRVKITGAPYSRAKRRLTDNAANATNFEVGMSLEFREA